MRNKVWTKPDLNFGGRSRVLQKQNFYSLAGSHTEAISPVAVSPSNKVIYHL